MSRSQDNSQEVKYVYDLPYTERKLLCNILDSNYDWEKLGGKYMGLKWCDLEEFRRAERCGESPTNRLLQIWGQQNHTVSELFLLLWKMEHFQAMRALKSCVPEKYHKLFTNAERRATEIFSKTKPVGGIVRRNSQEPKRAPRPSTETAQGPTLQISAEFPQNNSTLGTTAQPSQNGSVLEASARPVHIHSEQQPLTLHESRQQPQSVREDTDGTPEGACALVESSHCFNSHNFNQGASHSNSYVTSPKIPEALLNPTATLHTTVNSRRPMADVTLPKLANNHASKQESVRKINNNEIYGTCAEVSCEDNNLEELKTRHKAAQYDPHKDYLDKLEEKRVKEMTQESGGKEVTRQTNSSGGASLTGVVTVQPLPSPQGHPVECPGAERHRRISNASDTSNHSTSVPVIPYKELEEATALWNRDHLLGRGGFGCVFKGVWKNTEVAIKRIEPHDNASLDNTRLHISQSLEELKLLQSYRHDNILQVYGYSTDHELSPCLVYQFMPNGSVEDRLQCRKIEAFGEGPPLGATTPLSWWQRFRIAWGTARALQFLHTVKDKPLIHGDVKSANILLDQNYEPKLGDFGLAREGKSQSTSMKVSRVHGTKPYLPDDYLRSKKLSVKVDTYSYGVVLFELCTGLRAYDEKRKERGKFLKDLVDDTTDEESLRDRNAGINHEEVFTFLYKLGKDCVHSAAGKRPDMTTVFKELESYGVVLDERARAKRISLGEMSSVSSTPHMLQIHYDTAGSFHSPSPSPSTQPSLPHFFHHSPSPSPASMLPPYHSPPSPSSIPPRSPVPPGLSPNSHVPPHYSPCPAVLGNVPRLVANGSVAYHPRMFHYGGTTGWKQGAGGNIVYGMNPLQPSIPQFHVPHINVSPTLANGSESRDPPSYSETISRLPSGAVGNVPPMIPQLSGLYINDGHGNENSNESYNSDSDCGYSESSSITNTTQNVGMINVLHTFRQGAVADSGLPTVLPTVISSREGNSRENPAAPCPLLTELGTKSTTAVSSRSLSNTEMPTAAKKQFKLFG